MKSEPSDHYEELKALLSKSFHSEEGEDVPPIPDQIRDRIRDQYGRENSTADTASPGRDESLIAKLSRLFAQPQFSGAMAAVALIAVAAFLLVPDRNDISGGEMRGKPIAAPANPATSIIIHDLDPERAEALRGVLDPNLVVLRKDISGEPAAEGITIIISGPEDTIEGYAGPDSEALKSILPSDEFEAGKVISKMIRELSERMTP